MEVREPVVANNATATTVVFIAPGPPNPPSTHVLYVGVTYTGNSPYRSEVPAVSSRLLARHEMFQIAKIEVTTGTRISVNSLSRDRYPIHYVYGFSSEGFSYFLTTQMRESTNNSPYISKLVRVCQDDHDYYSYTEVPLECVAENGTRYNLIQAAYVDKAGSDLASKLGIRAQNDVLYAVFAQSDPVEMSNRPIARSALCVYSLKSIRRKFMRNIQRCFSGEGHRGLDFISPSLPCVHTKLQKIGEDFCGMYVNTPLGGDEPVMERPVYTTNNVLLTAVAATLTGNFTVVFLGTSKRHLKKMSVENAKEVFEYEDIAVDEGSRVSSQLVFDPQRKHLYAMTENKVTKVRVQDCGVYTTCEECLGARDPYCGWCSPDKKCSLRSDCQDAIEKPFYWILYESERCTTVTIITSVTPNQIQRTTVRTLSLVIENLPTLSDKLQCAFSAFGKTLLTNATRTANGVSCSTPRTNRIPANPSGKHDFTVKLSLRMTSESDFVATNIIFFDCPTFSSCTECVSSSYPCDWCVAGHRCTYDTFENCGNDTLVTGLNRIRPSIRIGPGFCPRINATAEVSTEILVGHGTKKGFKVKVENIEQFMVQENFICQYNIEGSVTNVSAQILDDNIYCEDNEFTYSSRASNVMAKFAVIWGGSKPLDNPDNVHFLIYRCREMADNCGLCLSLTDKYLCGWCQTSGKCEVREQCDQSGIAWLHRDQICPNPEFLVNGSTLPMRTVCRFDNDQVSLNQGFGSFSANYIDPYLCSHILFETRYLLNTTINNCKIRFSNRVDNTDLAHNKENQKIMKLTSKNPQLKVMLSIKAKSIIEFLSDNSVCSSKNKNGVEIFAEVFVETIRHYKFLGLDIMYETNDAQNVVVMTKKALRKNGQLFSITIKQDAEIIDLVNRTFNHTLIDFINFEFGNYRKIDGKASHHSPLYENFPNNPSSNRQNVNEIVQLIKQSFLPKKIVWGILPYGCGWEIPPNLTDTRPPVTVISSVSQRVKTYSGICRVIRNEGWQVFYEDDHRNISPYAVAPINDPGRMWISFEDPATVIVKSKYILEEGLGGVYLSKIDYDDFDNICGEGRYPILTAISRTLNNSLQFLVIRDENIALRCNIAFALGLLIVIGYVLALIYVFVKFYQIGRQQHNQVQISDVDDTYDYIN